MEITAKQVIRKGSAKGPTNGNQLSASQQVNRLGKYLYKNLDGAFKIQNSSNMCDVYVTVLYQIPAEILKRYNITDEQYTDVHEMTVNINITTYQNKVRINVIEMTNKEKTIGFDLYDAESLVNLQESARKVFQRVCSRIAKEFKDYDFLF